MPSPIFSGATAEYTLANTPQTRAWDMLTEMFRAPGEPSFEMGHWPLDDINPQCSKLATGGIFQCIGSSSEDLRFIQIIDWAPPTSFGYITAHMSGPELRYETNYDLICEAIVTCSRIYTKLFVLQPNGSSTHVTISHHQSGSGSKVDGAAEALRRTLTGNYIYQGEGVEIVRDDSRNGTVIGV